MVALVVAVCIPLFTSIAAAAGRCREAVNRLVSVQGRVEVQRSGQGPWTVAGIDEALCPGDSLRVGADGRAALVRANQSILRLDRNSTLSLGPMPTGRPALLRLLHGVLHIFSHRPNALTVDTPYVSGAVEGTEFLVRADPTRTVIVVFEGRIRAVNGQGRLDVGGGQAIVAERGTAPQYMTVVRPRDAVQWTLYYPVIIDRPAGPEASASDPVRQAVAHLAGGRVAEARALIAAILQQNPASSEAYALQAIIAVVQNRPDQALDLAARAIALDPRSVAAALALSYARQAVFDIPGALAVLATAREANPASAELLARLAELQLSVGDLEAAEHSARQAVVLDPAVGRSRTVLGFACLTRIETGKAKEEFRQAMVLDPAHPLAHLGLGLALIREGELEAGRAEIEIAAALDPGNALIRSYLGKAYDEEKRDSQARRQYEIAKALDPADPTPWFYDALRQQGLNRPVAALHELQRSIALNDNRAVYRSRLLLDDDLASRSASLGRIYSDLGFQQLALVEGWQSVNTDPGNSSAHRFLADTYGAMPRHQIARVSELLQSQLLQPLSLTPVQPQLAESNLYILDGAGPASASFNEYSPLFVRNRTLWQTGAVAGGNATIGEEVVQSTVWNRLSCSLGQYHYQSDGFRDNNDQDLDLQNALVQYRVSAATGFLSELRHADRDGGDLELLFDPDWYFDDQRQHSRDKTARVGFLHSLSPAADLVGVVTVQDFQERIEAGFAGGQVRLSEEKEGYSAEMQHQYRQQRFNTVTGVGMYDADSTKDYRMVFDPGDASVTLPSNAGDIDHANGYLYSHAALLATLDLTLGASYDAFANAVDERDQLNPKIGLAWTPVPPTTFRAAAFRVLTRTLVADQTIEPTQVAGFNQFYDDAAGVGNWVYGGAVDQRLTDRLFGGLELTARRQDVPYESWDFQELAGAPEVQEADWEESLARAYLYWTAQPWLATSLEYFREDFDRGEEFFGTENFRDLRTHRLRMGASLFQGSGLFLRLYATYVDQQGEFFDPLAVVAMDDDDQFWVVDGGVGYRLPKRRGIVALEAKNLFDQEIRFQDTDPGNPRIAPDQLLLLRVTLVF